MNLNQAAKINILTCLCAAVIVMAGCTTSSSFVAYSYNEGKKHYINEEYEQASRYFKQYVTDFPDNPMTEVALYYLANSYKEIHEYANAQKTYQMILNKYTEGFWVDSARSELKSLKEEMDT